MSIDQSTPKPFGFAWLKPSHRTWPEQGLGASIFLLVALCFEWLSAYFVWLSLEVEWIEKAFLSPWVFSSITSRWGWVVSDLLIAAAMWQLWRRYSLTRLKLELALFLLQFVLQLSWAATMFFHESLLALIVLLFLSSNAVLAALLFWKKERLGGRLWTLPIFWNFYAVGMNMMICLAISPRGP